METTAHVVWDGPFLLGEVAGLDGPSDRGVYQIYGPHVAYGQYALLYLGRTAQPFAVRVPQHGWDEYERATEIRIHVGRLVECEHLPDPDFERRLCLVEWLLIYAHGPAYNSQLVRDPPPNAPIASLRIFNWKNRGALLPEVSGARWLKPAPGNTRAAAPRDANA